MNRRSGAASEPSDPLPRSAAESTRGDPPGNKRLDPTKMKNQPAMRTSSGLIWIVMGGFFAVAAAVPFSLLIAGDRPSHTVAMVILVIVAVLYVALITVRFVVQKRVARLRVMAACMLSMAAVALIGAWLCVTIESAAA